MNRYAVILIALSLSLLSIVPNAYVNVNQSSSISLPQRTFGDASVFYNGSLVLIGQNSSVGSNVIEYQDGKWVPLPPMPVDLSCPSAVVYDGKIYVIGGLLPTNEINNVVYVFNGSSWSAMEVPEPDPAYGSYAFVYQGEIYVIGGSLVTSPIYFATPPSTDIRVFNPSSGSWEIIGEAPYPMGGGGYVFNGTDMIVVGGYIGGYGASYTNRVSAYNPSTGVWYSLPSFPMQLGYEAVGYLNGVLFVAGGLIFTNVGIEQGRIYYLVNGSWRNSFFDESPPLFQSSYVQRGNQLYIVGGYNGNSSGASKVIEVLNLNVPPCPPDGLKVISGNETATFSWAPVNFSSGYYLRLTYDGLSSTLNVGNVTSFNVSDLIDGLTYSVQVMAYNQAGNSSWSTPVSFTPSSVPNPPTSSLQLGDRNATVFISPPTFNGGFRLEGFYLTLENATFVKSVSLSPSVTNYTFTGLVNGSQYTLKLLAYNRDGNSSPAILSFIATGKPKLTIYTQSTDEGLVIHWGYNLYSNYTVDILSGRNLVYSGNFSNVSGGIIKIPFGTYDVIVFVQNPAGSAVSNFTVNYFVPPKTPLPLVEATNGNLTVILPRSTDVQYYEIYLNGYLVYKGDREAFYTNISSNVKYNLSVIAVNPSGESAPFSATVVYYSSPHNVTSHGNPLPLNVSNEKVIDPQLPLADSISVIVLAISVLWIFQQILKREAESRERRS